MRVAFLTAHWPPRLSGHGDFAGHLAAGFVESGDIVDVRVLGQQDVTPLPGAASTRAVKFPARLRDIWRLAGDVARLGPDVVCLQYEAHAFNLRARPHLLPLALRLRGCRVAVMYHELWRPRRLGRTAKLVLLTAAHRVVAFSDWHAAGVRQYRRVGTVDVIPAPTNFPLKTEARPLLRARFGVPADTRIVTFFGFVIPEHRLEEVVVAVGTLKRQGRAVVASIIGAMNPAGNSYHQKLLDLAREQDVREQFIWHGRVDDSDAVGRLLAISDVGVLPYNNGVGENNGAIAALAHFRVPTVTTAGPRSGTMEAQGVALFTDGSAASLAAAIATLLDDRKLAENIAVRASRWSEERSWEVVTAAHRTVLEQCARRT